MAITYPFAKYFKKYIDHYKINGNIITLGKQNIAFDFRKFLNIEKENLSDTEFFKILGFDSHSSIDFSNFEGSKIIHDMNFTGLDKKLKIKTDLVFETGTMEHIFNVPVYLENIINILKINGFCMQFIPINNFVDHGFYQFSPTLLFDYYSINGFQIMDALIFTTKSNTWRDYSVERYFPGSYDSTDNFRFSECYTTILFVAKKLFNQKKISFPIQRFYSSLSNKKRSFSIKRNSTHKFYIKIELDKNFNCEIGNCYLYNLQNFNLESKNLYFSLLENENYIGNYQNNHQKIREIGFGAFCVWNNYLYFSTSDNSVPISNNKIYQLEISHIYDNPLDLN